MLHVKIDELNKIVQLEPDGALSEEDFVNAKEKVDFFLKEHEMFNGLIIYTQNFPGWDSFKAFLSHLEFVKEHHKKVKKIALVTDFFAADIAETFVSHFIKAKVKHFSFTNLESATKWILKSEIEKHGISVGIYRSENEYFVNFKAEGKLTHQDYELITPFLEKNFEHLKNPLKAIVDIEDFEGWELEAAWDDLKFGYKYNHTFKKIAIVGNRSKLISFTAKISSWFIATLIKEFDSFDLATRWLKEE